jgi:predicted ribosome-associated RNA-binding protein Tma20
VYSQKSANEFIRQLKEGFTEEIKEKFLNGRIKKLKKLYKFDGRYCFTNKEGEIVCLLNDLRTMTDYDLYKLLTA